MLRKVSAIVVFVVVARVLVAVSPATAHPDKHVACDQVCISNFIKALDICVAREGAARTACNEAAQRDFAACSRRCKNDCLEACKDLCDQIMDRCKGDCATHPKPRECRARCSETQASCYKDCERKCKK